jgi:N-formylglutamate deformylase
MHSLIVSIPHSGEMIPPQVGWLKALPEPVLMRDVDRYVDQLYKTVLQNQKIPHVIADCHRYVIDLNRLPAEYDASSVVGAAFPAGKHPKGLHWSVTTLGENLISQPMSMALHEELVEKFYSPFHDDVKKLASKILPQEVFHLDLHSMPSKGTAMHNDPGEMRADVVVSDFHGKSSRPDFVELIKNSYTQAGFKVAYNWPYFGGGITQIYGHPAKHHHTVQVELNRALYMDEDSKKKLPGKFEETQKRLSAAIEKIAAGVDELSRS